MSANSTKPVNGAMGTSESNKSPSSAQSAEVAIGAKKNRISYVQAAGSPIFRAGRAEGVYQHPPVLCDDKLATCLEDNFELLFR